MVWLSSFPFEKKRVFALVWLKGGAIFCYFGVVGHTSCIDENKREA